MTRGKDIFVTLWVVEDAQSLWIRAESRRRLWLDPLRENPLIELTRGSTSRLGDAARFSADSTRASVEEQRTGLPDLRST